MFSKIKSESLLFTCLVLFISVSAVATDFIGAPITNKPLSCRATAIISPAFGRTFKVGSDGKKYLAQFDSRYHLVRDHVESILAKKGYVFDETCDARIPKGAVYSACFGSSNTYLTIRIGYDHKRFFLKGVWPTLFAASIIHEDSQFSDGYYYEAVTFEAEHFQSNDYYDKLLVHEALKVPSCRDLKLQKIRE